jgi:heme A synthase
MIKPSDIEAKAREVEAALDETRESVQNTAIVAAVAVALFVILAFIVGRRRGKRSKAVIEVYRV